MKVYIVSDEDVDALLTAIDRDPSHGERGGSSTVFSQYERDVHAQTHRFFNYQVRRWLERIGRDQP